MAKKIILFLAIDYQVIMRIYRLVFLFVEECNHLCGSAIYAICA